MTKLILFLVESKGERMKIIMKVIRYISMVLVCMICLFATKMMLPARDNNNNTIKTNIVDTKVKEDKNVNNGGGDA